MNNNSTFTTDELSQANDHSRELSQSAASDPSESGSTTSESNSQPEATEVNQQTISSVDDGYVQEPVSIEINDSSKDATPSAELVEENEGGIVLSETDNPVNSTDDSSSEEVETTLPVVEPLVENVSDAAQEVPLADSESETSENRDVETASIKIETAESEAPSQVVAQSETILSLDSTEVEDLVLGDQEMEEMEKEDAESTLEDFSGLDKEQLVKLAEQLNRDADPVVANRAIQKIKPLFEALYQHDKAEALEKFVQDGGSADTFEYKYHGLEQRFYQAQKGIYEKRKINQEFQQKERAKNLEAKLTILEQLRQLVDDHEHTPGYEKFKVIREEWKKIGPVGPEHAQNLNASYYSLIERFYSLSEIYHNLRDFDRKKNLDLKLDLIARIEKLADEPMISKAMKDLMTYQDEFRSLGPVPKDKLEEIKERLKKAVDVIYERRRVFVEERKKLLSEEIGLKQSLIAKVADYDTISASSVKEWQAKTKELLAVQDEWKSIPGRGRDKTVDLNKQFWGIFKKFMYNKNEFFRELEKGKKDLVASKQALIDEVNSLKDGDDWDGIANRMKQLQTEWKNQPPVFGKDNHRLYEAFRAGIDHFFSRLREQRSGEDKIQAENLQNKEAVCLEIEKLAQSGKGSRKQLEELKDQFRNIGFVPLKSMQKINGRFSKAMMDMIDASKEIPENEKERLKINILSSRATYSTEGVKTLKNQEGYIQKRLMQLRKDVGNLEDNVSMFKMSKNAMALIEDVQKRINLSKLEIKELESQLKEIRNSE